MLPITITAGLLFLLVVPAAILALVLEPYWQRRFRTAARQRELDAGEVESWGSADAGWIFLVFIVLGIPVLLVMDGLVVRIGLLYRPQLSFFFPFDTQLQLAGAVLAAVGLTVLAVTTRMLAEHVFAKAINEREMLTTGIYAYVRHPYYLGFFLFTVGLLWLTLNILMVVLVVPTLFEADGRFITRVVADEERELVQRYGPAYEKYMARTGRFLPKFR